MSKFCVLSVDIAICGVFFRTICSHQRECLFGEVVDGTMQLNDLGQIVAEEWERSPYLRLEIKLDAWIVMHNHCHGIVFIEPVVSQEANTYGVGINDHAVGALLPCAPTIPFVPKQLSNGSTIAGLPDR